MIEDAVKFISYLNGSIRTPEGRLVAFWDQKTWQLDIDGHVESFRAATIEEAMDKINLVWVA
jgi:hypothetical protein